MDSRDSHCIRWLGVAELHITDGKTSAQWESMLV